MCGLKHSKQYSRWQHYTVSHSSNKWLQITCYNQRWLTWMGVGHTYSVFRWNNWRAWIKCLGPIDQPSFQPVMLKVFPALPMVMVLSHIPGSEAKTRIKSLSEDIFFSKNQCFKKIYILRFLQEVIKTIVMSSSLLTYKENQQTHQSWHASGQGTPSTHKPHQLCRWHHVECRGQRLFVIHLGCTPTMKYFIQFGKIN